MTKEEFLARCELIYDTGHAEPEVLHLLNRWLDFVMRFEGGQMNYVADFIEMENVRTGHFLPQRTLANDALGYKLQEFAAILTHSCQLCATDPQAWWTRGAFCEHKKTKAQV